MTFFAFNDWYIELQRINQQFNEMQNYISIYFVASDKALFQPKSIDIFLISQKNICCGYSLETPWWGTSKGVPTKLHFYGEIRKILSGYPFLFAARIYDNDH